MKGKPTTFQLAQLAAQAAPTNTRAKDAVRRAMELWNEAETGIAESENRRAFLHGLFHAPGGGEILIFADSPENWRARLKAYPGDERDVERAMWDQTSRRRRWQSSCSGTGRCRRRLGASSWLGSAGSAFDSTWRDHWYPATG